MAYIHDAARIAKLEAEIVELQDLLAERNQSLIEAAGNILEVKRAAKTAMDLLHIVGYVTAGADVDKTLARAAYYVLDGVTNK